MASVRSLDTALAYSRDPGTNDITDFGNITGFSTSIPLNGLLIRNIIHGMDIVMSHMTHLYHLSAADFINFEGSAVPMSPWLPSYTTAGLVTAEPLRTNLILNYVEALKMRRLAHTAGALYSGRQPIQNAIVPGGVTTHFDGTYPSGITPTDPAGPYNATTTQSAFSQLLTSIRNFIDTKYIPDVLTVATQPQFVGFFTQGAGCLRFLSYGDFPTDQVGELALKRGIVDANIDLTLRAFDQAYIVEQVHYSHYDYAALDAINFPNGRHPYDGLTEPNLANGYSWLKAPRYRTGGAGAGDVCEVGPLARMVVSYAANDANITASTLNTVLGVSGTYTVNGLVGAAIAGPLGGNATLLFSALGRHAARMLEAKFLADACADWNAAINPASSCYDYKKIPKTITKGAGLAEAPRGALGHWIKIEGRKVAKYQCVVPSTWNFSPRDNSNVAGAVEQSLETSWIGSDADPQGQIVNILRIVHPFDCCIACAVHVVGPDGKEKLSFSIDPDGRPSKIKIAGQ